MKNLFQSNQSSKPKTVVTATDDSEQSRHYVFPKGEAIVDDVADILQTCRETGREHGARNIPNSNSSFSIVDEERKNL